MPSFRSVAIATATAAAITALSPALAEPPPENPAPSENTPKPLQQELPKVTPNAKQECDHQDIEGWKCLFDSPWIENIFDIGDDCENPQKISGPNWTGFLCPSPKEDEQKYINPGRHRCKGMRSFLGHRCFRRG